MCLIRPIKKKVCTQGRAGIACLWLIDCEAIIGLTFDEERRVSAIEINCDAVGGGFTKVEFEKDTAFFSQEKTKVKSATVVTQTISFVEPVMTAELRKSLLLINSCCCLHAIVLDNTGRYHYAGITEFEDLGTYQTEELKTGDGSGNTGTDSTADSNEYVETLTATVGDYAPFLTASPEEISNNCGDAFLIGSQSENVGWGDPTTNEGWGWFGNQ